RTAPRHGSGSGRRGTAARGSTPCPDRTRTPCGPHRITAAPPRRRAALPRSPYVGRMDDDATASKVADEFFADYARTLLGRDPAAIAETYAVPALIAFPTRLIAVTEASQSVAFFASAVDQYDGVTSATTAIRIAAA